MVWKGLLPGHLKTSLQPELSPRPLSSTPAPRVRLQNSGILSLTPGNLTNTHLWKLHYSSSPAPPGGVQSDSLVQGLVETMLMYKFVFCRPFLNWTPVTFTVALQTLSRGVVEYAKQKDILFLQEEKRINIHSNNCPSRVICNQKRKTNAPEACILPTLPLSQKKNLRNKSLDLLSVNQEFPHLYSSIFEKSTRWNWPTPFCVK